MNGVGVKSLFYSPRESDYWTSLVNKALNPRFHKPLELVIYNLDQSRTRVLMGYMFHWFLYGMLHRINC